MCYGSSWYRAIIVRCALDLEDLDQRRCRGRTAARQQQDDPTQGLRWVNPPVWGDKTMCGFLFNYSAVANKMAKHHNHVAMSKCFETEIFDKAVMINGTLTSVRYNLF